MHISNYWYPVSPLPSALRDHRIQLHRSTPTELSITIGEVQLSDEGEYTCSIFTMPVRTARATVTVLGGSHTAHTVHIHTIIRRKIFNLDVTENRGCNFFRTYNKPWKWKCGLRVSPTAVLNRCLGILRKWEHVFDKKAKIDCFIFNLSETPFALVILTFVSPVCPWRRIHLCEPKVSSGFCFLCRLF